MTNVANVSMGAADAAKRAMEQLQLLTGLRSDSVSEIRLDGERWHVIVEAVEVGRIPPTTDILGSYAVRLDSTGELLEYRRLRRYHRNRTLEVE